MNAPALKLDRREGSDRYRGEIYRRGRWRVATCRDGIQWLLQRRRRSGGGAAGPRWESLGYFTTRAALLRHWRAETGDAGAELLALLPESFPR